MRNFISPYCNFKILSKRPKLYTDYNKSNIYLNLCTYYKVINYSLNKSLFYFIFDIFQKKKTDWKPTVVRLNARKKCANTPKFWTVQSYDFHFHVQLVCTNLSSYSPLVQLNWTCKPTLKVNYFNRLKYRFISLFFFLHQTRTVRIPSK